MRATKAIVQYRNSGQNCDIVELSATFIGQLCFSIYFKCKTELSPSSASFYLKPHFNYSYVDIL